MGSILMPKKREEIPVRRNTDLLDMLNAERRVIPRGLTLPAFLPTENIHNHWTWCRIFSQEIHTVLEKHFNEFEGRYLSKLLFGEVFHERVTFEEDGENFDSSVFFQALRVVRCNDLFTYGHNKKRLVLDCVEVDTSCNAEDSAFEKLRQLMAVDLLAELMAGCVRVGDFLVIYGDISLTKSKVIALNGRLQHHVVIAQYRHDGFVGPVSHESEELQDLTSKCRDPRYKHAMHENGNHEYTLHVMPNVQSY